MKLLTALLLAFCFTAATTTYADNHDDEAVQEEMVDETAMEHDDMATHEEAGEATAKAHAKSAKKMAAKDACKGLKGAKMTACKKKHSKHN
ncbi:MAG: hypothetical protein M9962_02485 [Oligoflexia bacterium]|nr:hypothetical protein [Oligoflexia bacterium]